ncbi:hypothetical protein M2359_001984 [Gordonia amarae]|uniref:Uncharacterized protein n=1 Tax=Gordonia amarae NBRC 15530 TaxID=1075090 RepID=G7GR94_9ACTN|nr:hypothetical protein [Gordonia amarae]GAB06119.1 hypothetical protein GOAMR_48_00290 [Gordonia amarae NBRC 15530]
MSYHDPVDRNRRNPADSVPPTRAYPQPPRPADPGPYGDPGNDRDPGQYYDERSHGGPVYRDQEYYAPNQYDNPRDYQSARPYGQQYGAPQQYGQPYDAPPQYEQPYPYEQPQPAARQSPRGDRSPRGAYGAPARERKQVGPDINPGLFVGGVVMTGIVTGLAAWLAAWVARIIVEKVNDSGKLGVWNPLARDEYWFAVVAFLCALAAGALWYVLQLVTPSPDAFFRWIVILLIVAAVLIPLLLSAEISVGIATAILHLIIGLPILALIPAMGQKSLRR